MIRRICYANDDWTRTADVSPLGDGNGWVVWLGDKARNDAGRHTVRTMTQAQGIARAWVSGRREGDAA